MVRFQKRRPNITISKRKKTLAKANRHPRKGAVHTKNKSKNYRSFNGYLDDLKTFEFFKNTKNFRRFLRNFPKQLNIVYGSNLKLNESLIRHLVILSNERAKHRGRLDTAKHLKDLYSVALDYASDKIINPLPFTKSDKAGFPIKIYIFKEALSSDNINERRSALCILQLFKTVVVNKGLPNLSGITRKPPILSEGTNYWNRLLKDVPDFKYKDEIEKAFYKELNSSFPQSLLDKRIKELVEMEDKLFVSSNNGPNGTCLGAIIDDYNAVTLHGIIDNITNMAKATGNKLLSGILEYIYVEHKVDANSKAVPSKLAIKYEPGGKVRFFAIADWFTQSALVPIHKWLSSWLLKQPEDGTHNQDYVSNLGRLWSLIECAVMPFSTDLTQATDNIDIRLQAEILKYIFGVEISEQWLKLMVQRDFDLEGQSIKYGTGQAMGFLSSFDMLAVWHIIILRTCYRIVLKDKYDKYTVNFGVIGDDDIMDNKEVWELYNNILRVLTIPTSLHKGSSPDRISGLNPLNKTVTSKVVDIAKRVFINGEELTPVSPKLFWEATEHPTDFPNLLFEIVDRGCELTTGGIKALSEMSYKPKSAVILATFPLWPAPLKVVRSNEEILNNFMNSFPDLVWFSPIDNLKSVEGIFNTLLRNKLNRSVDIMLDTFKGFEEHFGSDINNIDEDKLRLYTVPSYSLILSKILDQCLSTFMEMAMNPDLVNIQAVYDVDNNVNAYVKEFKTMNTPISKWKKVCTTISMFDLQYIIVPKKDRRKDDYIKSLHIISSAVLETAAILSNKKPLKEYINPIVQTLNPYLGWAIQCHPMDNMY